MSSSSWWGGRGGGDYSGAVRRAREILSDDCPGPLVPSLVQMGPLFFLFHSHGNFLPVLMPEAVRVEWYVEEGLKIKYNKWN